MLFRRGPLLLFPMNRVGFIPPGEQGEQISVRRVWRLLEQALADEFELVRCPSCDPAAPGDPVWRAFVEGVEAVVLPQPIRVDRSAAPRKPFLHLALGVLPLGALRFLRMLADLRSVDSILVSCRSDQVILEQVFPQREIGVSFLPFGVDVEVFRPRSEPARTATRAAYRLGPADRVLACAGRLTRPKNIHLLLDMLTALRPEFPAIRLVIAGAPDPLDREAVAYRAELEARAREQGLGNTVIYAGPLDDEPLAELLSAADVFVTATVNRDENFGFAAVEAMACGLPVVGTAWGGLKDTIAPGENGFLMATRVTDSEVWVDVPAGIAAIRRLLAEDSLRRRMAAASGRRARAFYGKERFRVRVGEVVRDTWRRAARLEQSIPGTRFELHPRAMEALIYSELGLKMNWYDRPGGFVPEDSVVRRFFMGPYASSPDTGPAG